MEKQSWEILLDTLYEMGGYGEYPSSATENLSSDDVNLIERVPLSYEELDEAALTLRNSELVTREQMIPSSDDEPNKMRMYLQLETTGFNLAHDRRQAQQNRQSNRAVALLTLVLAVVGIAQATALTVQADGKPGYSVALLVSFGAAVLLGVVFIHLYRNVGFELSNR